MSIARRLILPSRLPDKGIDIGDRQRRRLEAEGRFPKRVKISARSHAYIEAEIDKHVEALIAQRDRGV